MRNYTGTNVVTAAMKLSAIFFCRPGELRFTQWDEINWNERQIEIPGDRMKISADNIIPLSDQAVTILETLHQERRGSFVFYGQRSIKKPISENTVRAAVRRMGYKDDENAMTAHGFRAMARTILEEKLKYPENLIEHQISHTVRGTHGRAYKRTTYLDERREMMQTWADCLDFLAQQAASGNDNAEVIPERFQYKGVS